MGLNGPLFYFLLPFFLGMIGLEYWIGRRRGLTLYRRGETLASLGIALGQRVIGALNLGFAGVAGAFAYNHALLEIPTTWWSLALLFAGVEFTYYWFHRASHEVRWFWTTHAVHHSIEDMNILAAYRLGWTSRLSMSFLFHLPLMWLGFPPAAVATVLAFNLFYQSWLHTILIGKLGPLEGVLNTPSAHRVHHAKSADYLDRNYGGVTLVFDRLFGTYVAERDDTPCDFGLVKPVGSHNPFVIAFHEWGRLFADLGRSKLAHWPGVLFGPPGWAPNGEGETSAVLRARYRASRLKDEAGNRSPATALGAAVGQAAPMPAQI